MSLSYDRRGAKENFCEAGVYDKIMAWNFDVWDMNFPVTMKAVKLAHQSEFACSTVNEYLSHQLLASPADSLWESSRVPPPRIPEGVCGGG